MKGVYLCACKARHKDYDIVYNDYDSKYNCDLTCDMRDVDLSSFDYVIASPPCNYYSRANYRRDTSPYALATKDLLPYCLNILASIDKPMIVENVANIDRYKKMGILDFCTNHDIYYQVVGRHIYFTNQIIILNCPQSFDFKRVTRDNGKKAQVYCGVDGYHEGGSNVHIVIEQWLKSIHKIKFYRFKQFTLDI